MALTLGRGPFGTQSVGRFNFHRDGPDSVLFWDEFPKRVRVELGGERVADSRLVRALHETGHLMVLYFPWEDVDTRRLHRTDHVTTCPFKGQASYWSVQVGQRTAENAVWSYEHPIEGAPPMSGHVAFDYRAMDGWYQEDERVYAHPRDPYHRVDVHRASRHVVVRHGDTVLADSLRPQLLFETSLPVRYYLPPEDVRTDLLSRSDTVSPCPYKGDGQHWHLDVDGERLVDDVAWSLPRPLPGDAEQARDHICFYTGKVVVEVDGERVTD